MNFGDHQFGIYLGGEPPKITTDLAGLEEHARQVLSPEALGYIVPSAGNGATARANRAAFDRYRIVPRMLRGVAGQRDLSCEILGTRMPAPVLVAPMGVQTLVHAEGELATARAAAALGVPYIHSTMAGHSFEQVAEAGGAAPRWFQLYVPTSEEVCLSFRARPRAAGFGVLVVTLDTTLLGWRPADLDRAFLPFLNGTGLANWLTDPHFQGVENPVAHWAGMFSNPGLGWDDLAFLRRHWGGPIVLKGIVSRDDAVLAADHGMDGVLVSNHGGRQVDGGIAALDALPAIAEAVGDRLTVLFDSGVRSGADVVKALSLGARAVLIGRPILYGLALGGQAGVDHVLRCLLGELDITLALSGHSDASDLSGLVISS